MSVGLTVFLIGSAALFAVGVFAIVARRNAITTLLGTQFLFAAGAIAFVASARFGFVGNSAYAHQSVAATMALFAGAISLAELCVGLAMALVIYRESRSFVLDADRG